MLERRLTPPNAKEDHSSVPIYLSDVSKPIDVSAVEKAGNLMVAAEVERRTGSWFNPAVAHDLMIVRVRFHRSDVNVAVNMYLQCAEPFPYTAEPEQLQQYLSNAMSICMGFKFETEK